MKRSFILSYIVTVLFLLGETFLLMPPEEKPAGQASMLLNIPAEPEPGHIFTEKDDGRAVEVPVGKTVLIELPANPTTGYQWDIVKDDNASDIVRILTHNFVAPAQDSDGAILAGGPGTFQLFLRVEKRGVYPISLAYQRPWEKDSPPAKRWHMDIRGID